MDLVRKILLWLDQKGGSKPVGVESIEIEGHSPAEIAFHVNLLADAGFVNAEVIRSPGGRIIKCYPADLTWHGHDFLDTIREEETWRATKSAAGKIGGFTVEILKSIAVGYLKGRAREMGLPLD